MQSVFRLQPQGRVDQYKTYQILKPVATHFRKATCADVECEHWMLGFKTIIDESSELGRDQGDYIRTQSGRHFTESRAGALTVFEFPPGQRCFGSHQKPLDREPLWIVKDGDWRGNPTGHRLQHKSGTDWVDDFGEHQEKLHDQIEKG